MTTRMKEQKSLYNCLEVRVSLTIAIWIGVGAFIIGGGGGAAITHHLLKEEPKPIVDNTSEAQQEVILQLTDLDLVQAPCSTEFIKENDDLLCRELFCRMQQRGVDAQTSGAECEQIANVSNTITIYKYCHDKGDQREECIRLFRERK